MFRVPYLTILVALLANQAIAQQFSPYSNHPATSTRAATPQPQPPSASSNPKSCYSPTCWKDDKSQEVLDYFNLDPRTTISTTPAGEQLALFSAHTTGGSGYLYSFALLRYADHKLTNLFPVMRITNISDHALWSMPELSPLPIFLTADYIWEEGAHYAPHRYAVRAYRYNEKTAKYARVMSYDTSHKYPSADGDYEIVHDLTAERPRILKRLKYLKN